MQGIETESARAMFNNYHRMSNLQCCPGTELVRMPVLCSAHINMLQRCYRRCASGVQAVPMTPRILLPGSALRPSMTKSGLLKSDKTGLGLRHEGFGQDSNKDLALKRESTFRSDAASVLIRPAVMMTWSDSSSPNGWAVRKRWQPSVLSCLVVLSSESGQTR
eukprot:459093-Rhodomonas_salina.1